MIGFGFFDMIFAWGGLLALLLGGGMLLFRLLTGRQLAVEHAQPQSYRTARQLLDERLARGEIDQGEYERILACIQSHHWDTSLDGPVGPMALPRRRLRTAA